MGNNKSKDKSLWLTEEDIISLSIATGYSKQNVISYYKSFIADCPDGKLTKKQFKNMYRQLYPNSKSDKFCLRIFSIFDCDKDDCLNFGEFLRALKITSNGNIHDKLKCAFQIYDLNGDGHLDKKETKTILDHIYDMVGEDKRKTRKLTRSSEKKVDYIFEKYDLDRDGKLSLDEFIDGCLRDDYMSSLFKTTFLGSSASYSGIIPSGGDSPTVTSSGSSFDRVTKLRSNSVNDTLSTTSSSMASDMAKSGEAAESRNFASNFQLMRQNALRHAKKSFKSHHNLAYGADGDDTDERSNQNEISKEGFY